MVISLHRVLKENRRNKPMSTKELFEKYVAEVCPTCKNKKCNLCNITITDNTKEAKAKCSYYEKKR